MNWTQVSYLYDGSLAGFLTCVFEAPLVLVHHLEKFRDRLACPVQVFSSADFHQ